MDIGIGTRAAAAAAAPLEPASKASPGTGDGQ